MNLNDADLVEQINAVVLRQIPKMIRDAVRERQPGDPVLDGYALEERTAIRAALINAGILKS